MKTNERKAIVIATNKPIVVYRSSQRDTWISSADLNTEYKPSELRFK